MNYLLLKDDWIWDTAYCINSCCFYNYCQKKKKDEKADTAQKHKRCFNALHSVQNAYQERDITCIVKWILTGKGIKPFLGF